MLCVVFGVFSTHRTNPSSEGLENRSQTSTAHIGLQNFTFVTLSARDQQCMLASARIPDCGGVTRSPSWVRAVTQILRSGGRGGVGWVYLDHNGLQLASPMDF